MTFFFRVLMLLMLVCVLTALALGWSALEILGTAWPDVSVVMDGEVYRWSAPEADALGWWVLGVTLALMGLVVMVPLVLLFGIALPILLALLTGGLALAAAALVVALVLSPLWLMLWLLWRALRPDASQPVPASA